MHKLEEQVASIAPMPPGTAPEAPVPAPRRLALGFSGSGKEYFRIWIVNLLLTVATLGIYSAWAKVRRLQYFYRNTQLAGACFDFSGDPKAILKGRLVAVALLIAYHYAFGFSRGVGIAVLAILILGLPYLMRSALRFRLSNTSYRGLSFGFRGNLRDAYLAYFPPVITVLLPSALLGVKPASQLAVAAMALYLGWPLMHAAMKRYQHAHFQYGDQQSQYGVRAWTFYRPYLVCGLWMALGIGVIAVLTGFVFYGFNRISPSILTSATRDSLAIGLVILLTTYLLFLLAGPFMQVRINNLVWSNTSFPRVRIISSMKARGMLRLQATNVLLTLLTLGLYRPFAVVRVYRYRVEHLALEVQGELAEVMAGVVPRQAGAAGDGAADFIGVDLSW